MQSETNAEQPAAEKPKAKKAWNEKPPSELFLQHCCQREYICGPDSITCGYCKKVHEVEADEYDLDVYYIDGRAWPEGCECNGPTSYELFFERYKDELLDYLQATAADGYFEAKRTLKKISKVRPLRRDIQLDLDD